MSVYTKLNSARNQFHAMPLKKSGLNKFAGYSYFELADFLVPALKVFAENDLCAYVSFGRDLATMRIVDTTSGDTFDITSPMSTAELKGCHEVQRLGAVQSYLRRYLWVAALEIVEHDAVDASAGVDETKPNLKITPTSGAWEAVDKPTQDRVTEMAANIKDLIANASASEAVLYLDAEKLDADSKVALWTLLDSKTRSALKRANEERKAA